jgi:hypothetical protein
MLVVRPLTLEQANAFVAAIHRHHKPIVGHRFSVGAFRDGACVGVAIVGRPVARMVPQYEVAEVTRLATDGSKNACSILYAACARACDAMGFERIQTYTLLSESGASLRAAGWTDEGAAGGGDWNRPKQLLRGANRTDQPMTGKRRWSRTLTNGCNGAVKPCESERLDATPEQERLAL